jgi:hypothetical protein
MMAHWHNFNNVSYQISPTTVGIKPYFKFQSLLFSSKYHTQETPVVQEISWWLVRENLRYCSNIRSGSTLSYHAEYHVFGW